MTQFETIHATCVSIQDRGLLLIGPSGSGKSDLALRLIDRGAVLVSDDYTQLSQDGAAILASAPATISGKMEVRGLGLVEMETRSKVRICLIIQLDQSVDRMPLPGETMPLLHVELPVIRLKALEPSAPIKAEMALTRIGLPSI
jgi:serine kinase of HPr protein (carbohydrate metabolism regulator)